MEPVHLELMLRLPVAVLLFLLPGWLLGRCLGTPYPILTTFLGSAAILFNTILLLDAVHVPLHAGSVGAAIVLWCVLLGRRAYRSEASVLPAEQGPPVWPQGWAWLWLAPAAVALISIMLRAVIEPLSGWDNGSRWDYLARLMLVQTSLAHYPPVTALDFQFYSWCDGIPPLVPCLNFWIYSASGSTAPALTAVRVTGEAVLIGVAGFRLGRQLWGDEAGWATLAVLATSSLLVWSCAMGQESGLLTLSLLALVSFLLDYLRTRRPCVAMWAGIAAGIGAISREYGLAYILFGGGVLAVQRAGWKAVGQFVMAAMLVSIPWYLRNAVITENPLFPHPLGIFPSNPVHLEVMQAIGSYWGWTTSRFELNSIVAPLLVLAAPLLLLGAIGGWRAGRRGWVCLLGFALVGALWWWSVPYTAGGWGYANRVLAPGLALAGVLGGWIGRLHRTPRMVAFVLVLFLAIDAGRRAWLLPMYPLAPPWPYSSQLWAETHNMNRQLRAPNVWSTLVGAAEGRSIVVDHPADHLEVTWRGGRAVPWFSPDVRPMFGAGASFETVIRQLKERDVRFLTIAQRNPITKWFCESHPFWKELTTNYAPTVRAQHLIIYDLDFLETTGEKSKAPP